MGWPGIKTDCFGSINEPLVAKGPTWDEYTGLWDSYTTAFNDIGPLSNPIIYETSTITLPSDTTFIPLVNADVVGLATILMQVGTAAQGAPAGDFIQLATSNITAKYIKIKITVTGLTPKINSLEILLDGAIIVQPYRDINTLTDTRDGFERIGVGHFKVGMQESCSGLYSALISGIQDVAGGAYSELVNKTSTIDGFPAAEFKIYNSSGTLTDAVVDVYLKGTR